MQGGSPMSTYYLAVDIGASSGRHILGHMENGKMQLEEIHRFENGMVKKDGEMCWETDRLFKEIVAGLKKCKEIGKIPGKYSFFAKIRSLSKYVMNNLLSKVIRNLNFTTPILV